MQLPDAVTGNFTFLLSDSPPCCPGWHRGKKERAWTSQLSGGGVVDLDELSAACPPPGCLIRTAWVGAGHMGLCAVDELNFMGGTRGDLRTLFRFRQRIFSRWSVPHTPSSAPPWTHESDAPLLPIDAAASTRAARRRGASSLATVLFVQTKRNVTNLAQVVRHINELGLARARLIKWEDMSFAAQLRAIRGAAVVASGVGSSQINQFLLPEGSVAVCLGWRDDNTRRGIHYFDSHVLRSLDHARAVYYPSYSVEERRGNGNTVTLDLGKAVSVIKEALDIYYKGFSTPLPEHLNANDYDRAWEALVQRSDSLALQLRTNDYDWQKRSAPSRCTTPNGVELILWGVQGCPWQPHVQSVRQDFGL